MASLLGFTRTLKTEHLNLQEIMNKSRLEAFSDSVIAVIITIMVLEMKVPKGTQFSALQPLAPVFLSYMLSFIYVAIYWNNHHHLMHAAQKINGKILWANLHLLFWLSLFPFLTGWMGENGFATLPVALYGVVLFLAACAYYIFAHLLIVYHGKESTLAKAIGSDVKGKVSVIIYAIAIPLAFYNSWFAYVLYMFVAVMWLIPDRRIENIASNNEY